MEYTPLLGLPPGYPSLAHPKWHQRIVCESYTRSQPLRFVLRMGGLRCDNRGRRLVGMWCSRLRRGFRRWGGNPFLMLKPLGTWLISWIEIWKVNNLDKDRRGVLGGHEVVEPVLFIFRLRISTTWVPWLDKTKRPFFGTSAGVDIYMFVSRHMRKVPSENYLGNEHYHSY